MSPDNYHRLTQPLAKRLGWWWRSQPLRFMARALGTKDSALAEQVYAARFEESAWRYEVGRRLGQIEALPFDKLPLSEMERVAEEFFPSDLGPEVVELSRQAVKGAKAPGGWTRLFIASFNLAHSTEALTRRVAEFIEQERKKVGAARPPHSNKGQRNRPLSWRALEMLDLQRHYEEHPKVQRLVDIDHSAVSKLKRNWPIARGGAGK